MRRLFINAALLLPVFCLIFICSYLTPYFGNDFRYMLIQGTTDLVGSCSDILLSQWRHYFEWGGRTVNHLIAQWLLYIGKPLQSLITALAFCSVIYMISALGCGSLRPAAQKPSHIIFAFLMLWLCLRSFGEVVINVVSSANYLFSTLIVMIFLLPFRQSLGEQAVRRGWTLTFLMLPLGIAAGWCNENTGFAVVSMVGLYNLKLLLQRRLQPWQFTGGIGLLAGYIILMIAPGNQSRYEFMESGGFDFTAHFLNSTLGIVGLTLLLQHVLLLALALTLWKLHDNGLLSLQRPQVKAGLWLCAAGFLSFLIMLASPTVPARSAAPLTIITSAGVLALVSELEMRGIKLLPRAVVWICGIICLPFVLITAFNMTQSYYQAYLDNKVRGLEIILQLQQGSQDLKVHPLNVKNSRYVYIADVHQDPAFWANRNAAMFYNVNSISRTCDNVKGPWPDDVIFIQKLGRPVCE